MVEPSPEQLAICDHVATSSRNLVVEASPGSGKTTTIGMAARELPLGRLYCALAFAKSNAEDFQRKLPIHVMASTSHSLCLAALRRAKPSVKVSADKVKFIVKDNFPTLSWELTTTVIKLVSIMKQQPERLTLDEVEELASEYNITASDSRVAATAVEVLALSDAETTRVDFDDMLRHVVADPSVTFPNYALVFVDEAQDTNAMQRAILRKLNTRCVVVGDPYQSIYGFRGASHSAMDELKDMLDADVLPLSVSHRCPQAVCGEAQRVLTDKRFMVRGAGETSPFNLCESSELHYEHKDHINS